MHRVKVRVVEDALDANNTIARANRDDFDRARRDRREPDERARAPARRRCSRGSSATTASTACAPACSRATSQGSLDADRLAHLHIPVVQLNTDGGFGGECHLDANMVRSALPALPLDELDLLIIENVGNLVCPAEFRVGEDARIMVSSVAEGEDKPLKYPLMFRACELVVVNKIDLLEHVDFDMDHFLHHLDAVHPGVEHMLRERAHRRGRRRAARRGSRALPERAPREPPCERGGGDERRPRRRAARRARRCQRALLRGRGRPPDAGLPRDGGALRARRPAARVRRRRRSTGPTRATSPSSSCTR